MPPLNAFQQHAYPRLRQREIVLVLGLSLFGCGEQYCQRGANGPTRCYDINQVEWQETLSRPEPPPERSVHLAPGCGPESPGRPIPSPVRGNAPVTPYPYLVSAACVSRRVPVQGALR